MSVLQILETPGCNRRLSLNISVLIVDDSILRGATTREIVRMAREAGAKKVTIASSSAPVIHPHIYRIDLASPKELVAYNRDSAAIAKYIGADEVIYQSLADTKAACAELSPRGLTQDFEDGVFSGKYATTFPEGYLEHIDALRSQKKNLKGMGREVIKKQEA